MTNTLSRKRSAVLLSLAWICFAGGVGVHAATIVVNSLADSGPGSLREAISTAAPGDTIQVTAEGTINLSSGVLIIDKDLSIAGPGADLLTLNGSAPSAVFWVTQPVHVSIRELTVSNALNSVLQTGKEGGAINNVGTLTLTRCVVRNSTAAPGNMGTGGGIYNLGTLILIHCIVRENTGATGGIKSVGAAAQVLIENSSILTNRGSGISAQGILVMLNSTVAENRGVGIGGIGVFGTAALINSSIISNINFFGDGGGIFCLSGTLLMTNCTVSENINGDGNGGGIAVSTGEAWIRSCTIVSNFATFTSGGLLVSTNAAAHCKNTILAGNRILAGIGSDVSGTLISEGYNLIQNPGSSAITGVTEGNILGLAAGLGPLQDNGGPTLTHALLPGSPAIDAVSPTDFPPTDQRGVLRPDGGNPSGRPDIGAFELECPCQCLAPFDVVQNVLTDLRHVLASVKGSERQRLAAVVQQLTLALKPAYWKDTAHLQPKSADKVFNYLANAIKLLEKPRKNELSSTLIERLACATQLLRETQDTR